MLKIEPVANASQMAGIHSPQSAGFAAWFPAYRSIVNQVHDELREDDDVKYSDNTFDQSP
jgi:hypothetical protein